MDEPEDLTETERRVLRVVADEGRVNPHLVSEKTRYDEDTVTTTLDDLVRVGRVRRVTTGLYDVVDHEDVRGIPEIPNEETQTAPIEPVDEPDDDEPDVTDATVNGDGETE